MSKNPFYFRVIPLDAPFCDREKEMEELTSKAISNNNVVLYSPRRYGKTSLVKRVQNSLVEENIETIYIDISNCKSCDKVSEEIAKGIHKCARRKESLKKKVLNALTKWKFGYTVDNAGSQSFTVLPTTELKGLELLENTMESFGKIIEDDKWQFNVAIDEFQEIVDIPDGDEIEGLLWKYIQHHSNASYFFLGSRRRILIDMFDDSNRSFYQSSRPFRLWQLPRKKAVEFIVMCFEIGGKKCGNEIAEKIVDATRCYPSYVQELSSVIYDISTEEEITENNFDAGFERMMGDKGLIFRDMEKKLKPAQKKLLKALAVEPVRPPYASSYLRRHHIKNTDRVQRTARELDSLDYIEKNKEGYCQITDPIFGRYLLFANKKPIVGN